MISTYLLDFSRVLLFPVDAAYHGELNAQYSSLLTIPNFNFTNYYQLNLPFLEYLHQKKSQRQLHIFTSGFIQNDDAVKPLLDQVFHSIISAGHLALSKSNPDSYIQLLQKLGCTAEEVIFIDDSESNISAARQVGIHAVLYTSVNESIKQIEAIEKANIA